MSLVINILALDDFKKWLPFASLIPDSKSGDTVACKKNAFAAVEDNKCRNEWHDS